MQPVVKITLLYSYDVAAWTHLNRVLEAAHLDHHRGDQLRMTLAISCLASDDERQITGNMN